ncbi:MarR-family transcriptional regulator [Colletotrichum karsti]|uniref:MarR-family transcriptional regulator n=1 Tax=Colletotrichum karsti TaxID=1095194 RepID=A0A9P6HVK7_9PEZI|nr:MarR-family transcriptional regulator [Colletotrichum karsti]KAF9870920.1 MarR-family transcriptional regulator [Colletotrichum karsti]
MKTESPTKDLAKNGITIRNHRPGDMGFITYRHGVIYAQEYGYGAPFESLVGRITADFIDYYDPAMERCWIAEKDGQFLGCIILHKDRETPGQARLRCFLVEESARGLGIGSQLVKLCIDFAKEVGYQSIMLRTDSHLSGARRLYTKAGFTMFLTEEHTGWGGEKRVGESWELKLPS